MVATLLMYNKPAVKIPVENIDCINPQSGSMFDLKLVVITTKDGSTYKGYHVTFN